MDESLFRELIDKQQTALAELDSLLNAKETSITQLPTSPRDAKPRVHREMLQQDRALQTRFDDACRLLADAYLMCDDRQRAVLRELVQSFRGVIACMWIDCAEIRTKIDGPRFRLALIYESLKDLHPDAQDAVDQLEFLRRSAKNAGFDPNPYFLEIAEAANTVGHSGKGSMRELMLAMVAETDRLRCERCDFLYSAELPQCPFCGAFTPWPEGKSPPQSTADDEPGPDQLGFAIEVQVSTLRLLGYVLVLIAPVILVILIIGQIVWTFQVENYHATRGAWSHKFVIVILAGIIYCCRSAYAHMADRYRRGYALFMGCGQMLAVFAALVGLTAAIIAFVSNYGMLLGW